MCLLCGTDWISTHSSQERRWCRLTQSHSRLQAHYTFKDRQCSNTTVPISPQASVLQTLPVKGTQISTKWFRNSRKIAVLGILIRSVNFVNLLLRQCGHTKALHRLHVYQIKGSVSHKISAFERRISVPWKASVLGIWQMWQMGWVVSTQFYESDPETTRNFKSQDQHTFCDLPERELYWSTALKGKGKGKFTLEQATKAHRGSRDITLLFL